MFSTMIALAFALSAPADLNWQTNYTAAKKLSAETNKPLAVFLGAGEKGYDKLSKENQLSTNIKIVLADNFVCVFIDTTTDEGRRLSKQFDINSGLGIVISDRTGNLQAFYHEGNLSNAFLIQYLEKYGDPKYVVDRTESNPGNHGPKKTTVVPTQGCTGCGCAGGCCGR